jgi:hypothetical protein
MVDRIRSRDTQIHDLVTESPNNLEDNDLRQSDQSVAHHLPTDNCRTDADLAGIAAAWPDLPEAIRAGIVAIVEATSMKKSV